MRPPPLGRLIVVPALLLVGSLLVFERDVPADAIVPGSNGRIAFESTRVGTDYEIWTVDPDGAGLAQLTSNTVDDLNPAWSPDGAKIAFTRDKVDGTCTSAKCRAVFVMNADGSNVVQLTSFQAYLEDVGPAWAPGGQTILFSTDRPTNSDRRIFSAPVAGGPTQDLVHSGFDIGPDWKPDGTKFVFQSNRDGSARLYTADANGTNQRPMTLSGPQVPTRSIGERSLSPDGT